jgi:hypothetical protein
MSRIEWQVDANTHVVLRGSRFARREVELNGQRVNGQWQSKRFDFALPDGRAAAIHLESDTSPDKPELTVDRWVVPDLRYLPEDLRCPQCKADVQLPDEYCSRCGNSLRSRGGVAADRAPNGATIAIRVLAGLFVLFGTIAWFMVRAETQREMRYLAPFKDQQVLKHVDGVTWTAGELRRRLVWQERAVLIESSVLAGLMVFLAWWSRRKPLAAILVAAATYAALQVIYAIVEPRSLLYGIFMKVIIVAVLVRGIKSAMDLRTSDG